MGFSSSGQMAQLGKQLGLVHGATGPSDDAIGAKKDAGYDAKFGDDGAPKDDGGGYAGQTFQHVLSQLQALAPPSQQQQFPQPSPLLGAPMTPQLTMPQYQQQQPGPMPTFAPQYDPYKKRQF